MRKNFKVFTDIGEVLTLEAAGSKEGRRVSEADLSPVRDAVIVCVNEKIAWIGARKDFAAKIVADIQRENSLTAPEEISLGGANVVPGFVECHTHSVFAGNRAHEFEWRMQGQSYKEIAAKGGGIRFTVDETRKAPFDQLRALAQKRADRFARQGVTTLETKSGYGLDTESELRSLEVARALEGPRVVATYLGAHSRSPEIADFDSYIQKMCSETLPEVARRKLADRVDIYIEGGFFTPESAKPYLKKAKDLGLGITAHVEQLSDSGGGLAVLEFQPQSLDHLVFASDDLIAKIARTSTVAVLLPASDLYLKMQYPRAREFIDQGAIVALSTDFNPGTSPTQELSLVGVLARLEMKMSQSEVLSAFTIGAARALGQVDRGCLVAGKLCDFVVLDGGWRDLFYSVGEARAARVYRGGEILVN